MATSSTAGLRTANDGVVDRVSYYDSVVNGIPEGTVIPHFDSSIDFYNWRNNQRAIYFKEQK
tara:strand:+ start:1484 stop:1669 length:186 start_codon:yes stop_codon:yes gene_type:complete